MALGIDYQRKAIIVISGASRGIGSSIAINIARKLNENSIFLLLARSTKGLQDTKDKILQINKNFNVKYYIVDFMEPNFNLYESMLEKLLTSTDTMNVNYAFCFHNAAHLGNLKKAASLVNLQEWRKYYDMNLFSFILLNNAFIKLFQPVVKQLVFVNIGSKISTVPWENFAMYGACKASRDAFYRILAIEEPNYIVLNYYPGLVDTDMFDNVLENAESENLRDYMKSVKKRGILTPDRTVEKLLQILEKGDYKSGESIDYYDRE